MGSVVILFVVIVVLIVAVSTWGDRAGEAEVGSGGGSSAVEAPESSPGGSGRSSDQRRREPDVTESSQPTVSDLRDRLESAREEERWSEAMEFLEGLTSRVADPEAKAEFAYSAGVIARDELDQPGRAVTWFDAALDHDVMKLEAFEAIDRILTDQEEWKGLEQAHRRQLSRIVEQAERPATGLKAKIWKSLGHIYAERLEHPQSARTALQTASELTDDPEIEEMLEGLR